MQPGRRNYCQIAMDGRYALLDTARPIPKEGETLTNVISDSLQRVGTLRFLRIADYSDIKFLNRHQDVVINGRQVPFYSVLVLGQTVDSENSDE
jgi:hypothetical protein